MGGLTDDANTLPLSEGRRVWLQNVASRRRVQQPVIVRLLNNRPTADTLAAVARRVLVLRRGIGRRLSCPLLAAHATAGRSR